MGLGFSVWDFGVWRSVFFGFRVLEFWVYGSEVLGLGKLSNNTEGVTSVSKLSGTPKGPCT